MPQPIAADHVNAFVASAVEALEKMAKISPQVGPAEPRYSACPADALIILIGIEGDLSGKVLFYFDPSILKQILTTLLGEPLPPPTDPLCGDALGEVANVIAGIATGRLESLGLRTTITPPSVLQAGEARRLTEGRRGVVVPLKSAAGEMGICHFFEKT